MANVFVLGCAKTGSKLVRRVLMTDSSVNLLDELHFLVPRWAKQDFVRRAARIGPLTDDRNIDRLVELMYSNSLEGAFWRTGASRSVGALPGRIDDIDRERLRTALLAGDRSYRSVLQCLMDEHTEATGRRIAGAKFPVNLSHARTLADWFPDARIIHLVRDPRAVYTSMVKMSMKRSPASFLRRELPAQVARLGYVLHQFRYAGVLHRHLVGNPRYHLLRFEDLIRHPERQVRQLCDFLGIEFAAEMLVPPTGVGSNYDESAGNRSGFDPGTLDRWKNHIPRAGQFVIERSLRRQLRSFGYS